MGKETKESIKRFRDDMTAKATIYSKEDWPYFAMAYATAAAQLVGDDIQTQYLYEILYWAHYKIGNISMARSFFNMAVGYEQLKKKYLIDYKYFYPLPVVSIIGQTEIVQNYPKEKIEYLSEVDQAKGEWLVFLCKDRELDELAIMTMIKVANDNHKQCLTLSDGGSVAIKAKLYNKLRKEGKHVEITKNAKLISQYMHCAAAKVYNKK